MSNDFFRFRRFTVSQSLCAMKVGTDGTLLGAWAEGGQHILDIGTGTGLVALMMAQRYPDAVVTGIDIDGGAVLQARANVAASPFASRIVIAKGDVRSMPAGEKYDAIVCNPPFFTDALRCPDAQRTLARHAVTLTYRELMESACRLLADGGELSVVIPFDCKGALESEAALAGLFKVRECAVSTTERKPPRRYLLAFRRHQATMEKTTLLMGSEEYRKMVEDFYL